MTAHTTFKLFLSAILLFGLPVIVDAQSEEDSADVWSVIEAEWDAASKGDRKWPDRFLTDDFVGWSKDTPAPRDKASIKMWERLNDRLGKVVAHELYPLSIVVHGDMAVAHYSYSSAFEDTKGDIEMNNGRYTDVLVRTDDGWKFVAWHGGDDD